jgi:CheY-like chemotaxis protein
MKPISNTGKRILLVDDEHFVRVTMRLLLAVDKHTVVEAENGQQALELYAREKFDLVITDLDMPEMRGDKLAEAIRVLSPTQPIILITAYLRTLHQDQTHANLVLEKPFESKTLREAISKLVP